MSVAGRVAAHHGASGLAVEVNHAVGHVDGLVEWRELGKESRVAERLLRVTVTAEAKDAGLGL